MRGRSREVEKDGRVVEVRCGINEKYQEVRMKNMEGLNVGRSWIR
jgi:hypothetical protein